MIEFTLLTEKQASGENKLDILKKYSERTKLTDYAILLGGYNDFGYGSWPTQTIDEEKGVCVIDSNNSKYYQSYIYQHFGAIRPITKYTSIIKNAHNRVINSDGILEVEFGEYPQSAASPKLQNELEKAYQEGNIEKTSKEYTIYYDVRNITYDCKKNTYSEYFHNGKKYIRMRSYITDNELYLSNNIEIKKNQICWIEVQPVKWLIDKETNIALSKKLLFFNVPFYIYNPVKEFSKTLLKKYLDENFRKEILPSKLNRKTDNTLDKKTSKVTIINADKVIEVFGNHTRIDFTDDVEKVKISINDESKLSVEFKSKTKKKTR